MVEIWLLVNGTGSLPCCCCTKMYWKVITEIFVEILLVCYSRTTTKGVCWYSYLSSSYGQCHSKLMHYTPVSLSAPITDNVTQINNHLFSVYRQPVLRKAVNLRVSLKSFNPSGGGNFKFIFIWLMIVKAKLNYSYAMVKSHDEITSFTHISIALIILL